MNSNLIDSIRLTYGVSIRIYDDHVELFYEDTIESTADISKLERLYWALHETMKTQGIVVEF